MFTKFFIEYGGMLLALIATGGAVLFGLKQSNKKAAAEAKADLIETVATEETVKAQAAAKVEVATIKGASDAKAEVNKSDGTSVVNELRNKWSRD